MSKAFPCAAPKSSEMKRYPMEEHHTSANFPEMVALALEDLAGQKLLLLSICLKRMCKRHRKVLGDGGEANDEQDLSNHV